MKRILLLVYLTLVSAILSLQGQEIRHVRFSTLDGLPSNTVYASMQDHQGFIWMATEFGVSRFDGYTFLNLNQENGLSDNDVFKIFEDSQNRIWFLMSNGTLSYYQNGQVRNPGTDRQLENLRTTSYFNGFTEDKSGTLWFSTFSDGIYTYSRIGKVQHLRPLTDLAAAHLVPAMWKGEDQDIRVCGSGGVINVSRNPGVYETVFPPELNHVGYGTGISGGKVVAGQQQTLYVSNGPGLKFRAADPSLFRNSRSISGIATDKEGNLWVSTLTNLHFFGQSELSGKQHRVFFQQHTLSGCMVDRQNNVWVSSLNNGVYLVNDRETIHYRTDYQQAHIPVTTVFSWKNGIWAGNDRGDVFRIKNGGIRKIQELNAGFYFGRGRIRNFIADPSEKYLWLVSENGLFHIRDEKIESHFPVSSKSLWFDHTGNLLIGSSTNATAYNKTEVEKNMEWARKVYATSKDPYPLLADQLRKAPLKQEFLLPTTRVYDIKQDQDKTLWFATNSGLYSRQYHKTLHHKPFDELLGKSFQSLEILSDGTIVTACNGYGIFLVKNKSVRIVNTKTGLCSNYIKKIRLLGHDSLWVCTPRGLNLLRFKEGESKPMVEAWKEENGLISEDLFDIAMSHDTAYLASSEGITMYPQFPKKKKSTAIRLSLSELKVNGKTVNIRDEIQIPEQENDLYIRFIHLDFKNPVRHRFRYRLDSNQSWIDIPKNEIFLNSLSAGHYQLETQTNQPGTGWVKSGRLISIKVYRPMYEHPVVVVLLSILATSVLLLAGYFRYLSPFLNKQKTTYQTRISTWKEEQFSLVIKALSSIQELVSTNQNDRGIVFISRFRRFFKSFLLQETIGFHSLERELEFLEMYLEILRSTSDRNNTLTFTTNVQPNVRTLPLPSLLLIKTLDLACCYLETAHRKLPDLQIGLLQTGNIMQYTIETGDPQSPGPLDARKADRYQSLKQQMEKRVKHWNQTNKVKLELFIPDGTARMPETIRFHLWIHPD